MPFVRYLREELIVIAPPWHSFADTVDGLIGALAAEGAFGEESRADVARAVEAREAEGTTSMLDIGVGIPHARIEALERPALALAISASGLYEAVPAAPIRIVALVVSPATAADDHLRLLASLATTLRSPALRQALLAAPDGATALAALRAAAA